MKITTSINISNIFLIFFLFQSCGQKVSTDSQSTNTSASLSDPSPDSETDIDTPPETVPETTPQPIFKTQLNRSAEIRGVLGAPSSPVVKQYQLGDSIVDQNFVDAMDAASSAPLIQPMPNQTGSKATASVVKTWPDGLVQIYYDPEMGVEATLVNRLKANISAACYKWSSVSKIKCVEITDPASVIGPYLTITLAHVPLPFSNGQILCPDSPLSCATLGVQEGTGKNYIAVDQHSFANAWDLTRQMGVVLGLSYEHQRPGRDDYLQLKAGFNSLLPENAQYSIVPHLPAVSNDYDFGSIMHAVTVNLRDPDFLTGKVNLAFKTALLFENNYMLHRASQYYPQGSAGSKVNLPAYPSVQDANNVVALYGPPNGKNRPCISYNPKSSVPHGAQIGVYTTQAPTESSPYCSDEPRLCRDGLFVGNANASMGYKKCPIRCLIAGERVAYGESRIIYQIQTGTSVQCQNSRKQVFCDLTHLGDDKAIPGFLSCVVSKN